MDSLKQVDLIQAKQLINESLYDEALLVIKDLEEKGDLNLNEKVLSQILKSDISLQRGLYDRAFKIAEQAYKDSLGLNMNLITIDALLLMAESALPHYKLKRISEMIKEAEENLNRTTLKNADYEKR